jgi:predicted alpha/beta superfamily hydrolase
MKHSKPPFIAAILLLFFITGKAQLPTPPGKLDSIQSNVLNQQRTFRVVLPPGYDPKQPVKYDVMYVTDGDWNVEITSQIQNFLLQNGFMPQNIIVSVNHPSRDKDLTPTPGDNAAVFGGADNFLAFLEKELIPYINSKYSTSGANTLFGHSYGGLFVTYAFLTNPKPFDVYIAADPSYWWDKGYIKKLAAEKLNADLHNNKTLFITGRGGQQSEGMGIPGVDSVFKAKSPAGLRWKLVDYPGETHNSVKFKSIYDALRFTYEGFNAMLMVHPQRGIVLNNMPYKVWVFRESDLIPVRYTTDKSEPTPQSELAKQELSLTGPSVVKVKTFPPREQFIRSAKAEFVQGETVKAVPKPKNAKPGGWRYHYYEGVWDSLPNFTTLKPVLTGIAGQGFNFSKLPRQTNFACVIEGFLEIKENGYHVFILDSDDGSKFYLKGKLLMDHDGLHAMGDAKTYLVPLEKGFYPIRVELFQKEGGVNLELMYITPGNYVPAPVPIPVEVQWGN